MSELLYIGGLNGGKSVTEHTRDIVGAGYANADYFTFAQAMEYPDRVAKAAKGKDVVTHSSGFMAIPEIGEISRIGGFNAPLPRSRQHLFRHTASKTMQMHEPMYGLEPRDVHRYERSSVAETIAHPFANLGRIGAIAGFNAIEKAASAVQAGIPVDLAYTAHDHYYWPSAEQIQEADIAGIGLRILSGTSGIHDALLVDTQKTWQAFLDQTDWPVSIN
jgi:hypothetical protein